MNEIYSKQSAREGNDCLIQDNIKIYKLNSKFLVIKVTQYTGSWTPDEPSVVTQTFDHFDDALKWVEEN